MPSRHAALLFALPFLLGVRADLDGQAAQPRVRIDREYRLEATMLGYRGIGGDIDGIRNPTLWARTGETVRITIVNGEVMVHDIALEKQPVKSQQILERGRDHGDHVQGGRRATPITAPCPATGPRAWRAGSTSRTSRGRPRTRASPPSAGSGRSISTSRPARSRTGRRRATRSRSSRRRAVRRNCVTRPTIGPATTGSAAARAAARSAACSPRRRSRSPTRTPASWSPAARSARTRVELVRVEDGQPIFTVSGADQASLRPVVVDLRAQASKVIVIRLVDDETGAPTASYI